ncbi:MAG: PGPGW domain-containing protein [Nitrococcus sp.]|nr:PGPGW domain-containing protein [Nitrococcus sp.]
MPTIDQLLNLIAPFIPWLMGFSVLMLLISVVAVPWIATAVPAEYFTHRYRQRLHRRGSDSPIIIWFWLVAKNLLGGTLVILGVIMLVAPGQGVLTILLGLGIADFPGKFYLERRLVRLPGVLYTLNLIRRRNGRPPLERPSQAELGGSQRETPGSKNSR